MTVALNPDPPTLSSTNAGAMMMIIVPHAWLEILKTEFHKTFSRCVLSSTEAKHAMGLSCSPRTVTRDDNIYRAWSFLVRTRLVLQGAKSNQYLWFELVRLAAQVPKRAEQIITATVPVS